MTASSASPQRVFISGHSLTERPFPDYLEAIARGAGAPFAWNRQYREGSTIQQRTRGGPDLPGWEGYRSGVDRDGKPMDVIALLRNPPDGRAFDTLVITERNSLLSEVLWYDSVRSLRHFVDTFTASSPDGQVYFYEPWHAIDLDDPRSWIAYEKAASPAWACIVSAVNASFAARGDERRIVSVPIAYGLALLVERALASPQSVGIPDGGERRVLDALFTDNVHPRPIVAYYNALLFYAHVWGRSPVGAWAPDEFDPALVRTLQDVAADAVKQRATSIDLDAEECRSTIWSFQWTFWPYMNEVSLRKDLGIVRARWIMARHMAASMRYFWSNAAPNPFADAVKLNDGYWLPPVP